MVLHYAQLAADAGGVDAFLIGSELRGLTRVRSASGVYPAVTRLGRTRRRREGDPRLRHDRHLWRRLDRIRRARRRPAAPEVRFPLDPLWASSAIDVVGIDYYTPLADWRDGAEHLDRAIADVDLRPRLSRRQSARRRSLRLVLRQRRGARCADPHADHRRARQAVGVSRQGYLELVVQRALRARRAAPSLASPTAWVPQGKPIWFTEIGCPAVDKGANQPNVFPDPKSSESGAAVFFRRRARRPHPAPLPRSRARRIRSGRSARATTDNPVSSVYGDRMIDRRGDPSVDLGRAAVSGFSGRARRVERRRQLGDRPLADRPARRARRSTRWWRRS